MIATTCQRTGCDSPLPRAGRGRPARHCSAACRQAAYRARRAQPAIPAELVERDRWVRRSGSKVPLQVSGRNASSMARRTWTTYQRAAASSTGVGLGYVLAAGDGIVCLDLDGCLHEGRVAGWAQAILDACPDTWVEVSPSGTGLHVWGRGEVGTARVIRDHRKVEVYGSGRYIAVTGVAWRSAPLTLADLSVVLESL